MSETPRWWKTISQSPFTEVWKRKRLGFVCKEFEDLMLQLSTLFDKMSKNICCLAAWFLQVRRGLRKVAGKPREWQSQAM